VEELIYSQKQKFFCITGGILMVLGVLYSIPFGMQENWIGMSITGTAFIIGIYLFTLNLDET